MHETARCFGYPSDSTRAAREPGVGQLAGTASNGPGRYGRPGPPSPPSHFLALRPKPASRPCGSTLAGAGRRPLATGPWCPAGLRTGVPDRRPVSPLPSSLGAVGRARAGAAGRGSPPAPCLSGARRRSEPALSCARIAGPSQCGGSPAPRGCAGLQSVFSSRHHCGCSLGQAGILP